MIKFIYKYIQKRITKTKFISYIQKELYDKISDLQNFINICFGFLKIWILNCWKYSRDYICRQIRTNFAV